MHLVKGIVYIMKLGREARTDLTRVTRLAKLSLEAIHRSNLRLTLSTIKLSVFLVIFPLSNGVPRYFPRQLTFSKPLFLQILLASFDETFLEKKIFV